MNTSLKIKVGFLVVNFVALLMLFDLGKVINIENQSLRRVRGGVVLDSIQRVVRDNIGKELSPYELLYEIKSVLPRDRTFNLAWVNEHLIVNNETVISLETGEIITGEFHNRLLEKVSDPILNIEEVLRGESRFYYLEEFKEYTGSRKREFISEILAEHLSQNEKHPYLKEDKNFVMVKIINPNDAAHPQAGYVVFYPTRGGQRLEYRIKSGRGYSLTPTPFAEKLVDILAEGLLAKDIDSHENLSGINFRNLISRYTPIIFFSNKNIIEERMKNYIISYASLKIEEIHNLEEELNKYPQGRRYLESLSSWENKIDASTSFVELQNTAKKFVNETERLAISLKYIHNNETLYTKLISMFDDMDIRLYRGELCFLAFITTADSKIFADVESPSALANSLYTIFGEFRNVYRGTYYLVDRNFKNATGEDIQDYYRRLLIMSEDRHNRMRAFINFYTKGLPSDLRTYSPGTIAETLLELGAKIVNFGSYYNVWNYYKNLEQGGFDIEDRYRELLKTKTDREAFEIVWQELKDKAPLEPDDTIRKFVDDRKKVAFLLHSFGFYLGRKY